MHRYRGGVNTDLIQARQANVLSLADVVLNTPDDWGVLSPVECEALAARLLWTRRLYLAGKLTEFGGPGK
jgi:hypothetical protein